MGKDLTQSKLDIQVEPIHPNVILMHISNLADRFDDKKEIGVSQVVALGQKSAISSKQSRSGIYDTKYINVNHLAQSLYFSSTNTTKLPKIQVVEVPLSGVENEDKNATSMTWDQQWSKEFNEEKAVYPLFLNPEDKKGLSGIAL